MERKNLALSLYGFLPGPHGQFVSVTYPRRTAGESLDKTDCAYVCFIFQNSGLYGSI